MSRARQAQGKRPLSSQRLIQRDRTASGYVRPALRCRRLILLAPVIERDYVAPSGPLTHRPGTASVSVGAPAR